MSKRDTAEYILGARELRDDYKKVFLGSESGRRVLQDILDNTHVMSITFTGNSQTFYKEGQRSIGLMILQALDRRSYAGLESLEKDGLVMTEVYDPTEGE
jgi:DNA-binding PadR family transcriptional regulator